MKPSVITPARQHEDVTFSLKTKTFNGIKKVGSSPDRQNFSLSSNEYKIRDKIELIMCFQRVFQFCACPYASIHI